MRSVGSARAGHALAIHVANEECHDWEAAHSRYLSGDHGPLDSLVVDDPNDDDPEPLWLPPLTGLAPMIWSTSIDVQSVSAVPQQLLYLGRWQMAKCS
jgi:hypothetical protein